MNNTFWDRLKNHKEIQHLQKDKYLYLYISVNTLKKESIGN